MKRLPLTLIACLALSVGARAQDKSAEIPLGLVASDYKEASVVARVRVKDTAAGNSDGIYYRFTAYCEVVEPFKGDLKRGQQLEFRVRAEQGYDHKQMRGDRVAFLKKVFDKNTGSYFYQDLENSVYPYSDAMAAKLRRLKSQKARAPKRAKAGRPRG